VPQLLITKTVQIIITVFIWFPLQIGIVLLT